MERIIAGGLFAFVIFVGMLVFLELGLRRGQHRLAIDPTGAREGLGPIDGAVFALLGLLLAFSFSGAASRFDVRRELIVEEANDIGTAWLRIDLLPPDSRPAMKEAFRRYLDMRLEGYRAMPDVDRALEILRRANGIQGEIWSLATDAVGKPGASPSAPMLLLPALNAMFDITTTRSAAARTHPPMVIYALLAISAWVSALLAGYGMAGGKYRSWLHTIGFAAITAAAVYVIVDLEYPRLGALQVGEFDEILVDVRRAMD